MSKLKITETILRDAHQSLIATRMSTDEMEPILETLDQAGYHALEMWGGATFDTSLRFLNEDPWERLRLIKSKVKNTKLQMLLRGQNLLGYKNYSDDVVDEFVRLSIKNGIDIIRIFDALNDTRNMETSIKACKKYGGHPQGCIAYTRSPVHTNELFVKLAVEIEAMGAESICIKDMAGLLDPYNAYNLVKDIKNAIKIPLELHTHATSGLGSTTYLKAVEAGVDIIDTALSPFGEGTSQPSTEPLVATFQGTEYDTGISLEVLNKAANYFRPLRDKALESGLLDPKVLGVDINALLYQVPGGMLSNLVSQLKVQNAIDKYEDVLNEIPKVREDFGYPPLVTPSSQIIGIQAVLNVLLGERYKMVPKEAKDLARGMYGRPAVPIKEEILKKLIGDDEPISVRPADLLEPELKKAKMEIATYMKKDEDLLTYVLFPQQALEYFKKRKEREKNPENQI
ncbi:MAG: oxaloacetate decarboxylase subunit alpha [Fusobacteria bacterium]|nr:oxaloacetate decarboxylase subunit alpha [Fusobacteriota bacterium]